MPKHPALVPIIVPRHGVNTLCTVESGRIVDIAPVPVPCLAEYAISGNGWLAWIEDDGWALRYTLYDTDGSLCLPDSLPLPGGVNAHTLLFHRDVLFVGGGQRDAGAEILGMFTFSAAPLRWTPIAVPANVLKFGKRIDALVIDRDRLLAIDDVVYPKWLLVYDVSDPVRPTLARQVSIRGHGTYERIWAAALGTRWLALLSATIGDCGPGEHVALLDRETLEERFAISIQRSMEESRDPTAICWRHIAWTGDVLHVAAGEHGVAAVDMGLVAKLGPLPARLPLPYKALPDRQAASALRLVTVVGTRQILVALHDEAGYDTILLDDVAGIR